MLYNIAQEGGLMGKYLVVEDLNFSYGNKNILSNLSFSLEKGELISFLSTNGGGKTTLIKLLSGLLPSKNNIKFKGLALNKENGKIYLSNMGVVFSDLDRQFLKETVVEELRNPLLNLIWSEAKIKKRVLEIAEELEIRELLQYKIEDLSDFEKLRVLLATSILHQPKFLFLDDVHRLLDDVAAEYLNKILKKLSVLHEISIINTSSNLRDVSYSDRIFLLEKGKIVLEDDFDKLLSKDNRLAKAGIVIPTMMDVSLKLQFYDLIDDLILDERKLVNKLWK